MTRPPETNETTFQALREIIAKDYDIAADSLTPQTPLDTLEIDSLALIELIFTLEERFDVIAEDVPADLPTLGSVAGYIDGLVAARNATPIAAQAPGA